MVRDIYQPLPPLVLLLLLTTTTTTISSSSSTDSTYPIVLNYWENPCYISCHFHTFCHSLTESVIWPATSSRGWQKVLTNRKCENAGRIWKRIYFLSCRRHASRAFGTPKSISSNICTLNLVRLGAGSKGTDILFGRRNPP